MALLLEPFVSSELSIERDEAAQILRLVKDDPKRSATLEVRGVCVCICVHVCVGVHMCACVSVCVCVCVCMCVCVCSTVKWLQPLSCTAQRCDYLMPHPCFKTPQQSCSVWTAVRKERMLQSISTLTRDFDNLLGGGIEPRKLTEFCGAPGAGKTQLACVHVYVCANEADQPGLLCC